MCGKQNFTDIHPRAGLARVNDECSRCPLRCGFQIKPIFDDDYGDGLGLDPAQQPEAQPEGVFGDQDPPRAIFRGLEVSPRRPRPKPLFEDPRQTQEIIFIFSGPEENYLPRSKKGPRLSPK